MREMKPLWVSRDATGVDVCLWRGNQPELDTDGEWVAGDYRCKHLDILDPDEFPDLAPGECRRVVLTLAPKGEDNASR